MAILVHPAVVGNTDAVHTAALNPLGMRAYDANGGEYLYLKGVASNVQGGWVAINVGADGVVVALDNNASNGSDKSFVAISMAAVVADRWGWFCVVSPYGGVAGLSAAAATDAKAVVTTATAFTVDDAEGGAEILVNSAFYVSAVDTPVSGQAMFSIMNPYVHALTLD